MKSGMGFPGRLGDHGLCLSGARSPDDVHDKAVRGVVIQSKKGKLQEALLILNYRQGFGLP